MVGEGVELYTLMDTFVRDLITDWAVLELNDLLASYIKEQSAYIFAVGNNQSETNEASLSKVLSKCQEALRSAGRTTVLLKGILGPAWVNRRCRWLLFGGKSLERSQRVRWSRRFTALCSVLYIKRGAPPARQSLVDAAIDKHHDTLTTKHPDVSDTDPATREKVKLALRALIRELAYGRRSAFVDCPRQRSSWKFDPATVMPSPSACFENKGCDGGAVNKLLLDWVTESGLDFGWVAGVVQESTGARRAEDEGCPDPESVEVRERFNQGWLATADARRLECLRSFERYCDRRVRASPELWARPSAVVEPCKVRMVTMGGAFQYQRALSFQKFLHGEMKRTLLFRFIGCPIDSESGREAWDEAFSKAPLPEGWTYVSGDYTAATDNLNPELSAYALDEVLAVTLTKTTEGWESLSTTEWSELLCQTLVGHNLLYPKTSTQKCERTAKQEWGQLMGSPTSFPILNLVNAAATAVGLGWSGESNGSVVECLEHHGVRTNGDDIAFRCPEAQYGSWKGAVSACGLTPSIGKNYTSREFVIINSEARVFEPRTYCAETDLPYGREESWPLAPCDEEWTQCSEQRLQYPLRWSHLGFVNLPLLLGMCAKGADAGTYVLDSTCWWELSARAKGLIRGFDIEQSHKLIQRFLAYHEDVVRRMPPGVCKYIPLSLGGGGIPAVKGLTELPEGSRKRATWLVCLDTEKRLKKTTPPPNKARTVVQKLIRDAMDEGILETQIRPIVDPTAAERFKAPKRGTGSLLSYCLLKLAESEETYCSLSNETELGEVGKQDLVVERVAREKRYAQTIMGQCRAAQKCSLELTSLPKILNYVETSELSTVESSILQVGAGQLLGAGSSPFFASTSLQEGRPKHSVLHIRWN